MNLGARHQKIIQIVMDKGQASISQIHVQLGQSISIPQLNRDMAGLVARNYLEKVGEGRATAYVISRYHKLLAPLDITGYFDLDPDGRKAQLGFNHDLLEHLKGIDLFTAEEVLILENLKNEFQENISKLPSTLYQKEIERLTIELSWKSSQIEGNTYSLLETERLFKEKQEAKNKTKEEATMLLNHKDALLYILVNKLQARQLNLRILEEIHSLLTKDLKVSRKLRTRAVGITGTAYKPLDNEDQIRENLHLMCDVINARNNGFEKALLAVVLVSYIQPFEDGNKRTGRLISNAILIANNACPLSYRSVDSLDYKKAMLLFYEQNNLAAFKKIYMEQIEFAVKNYFR